MGRDQVRAAILEAEAFVDYLTFTWRRVPDAREPLSLPILEVRRSSDARSGYITTNGSSFPPVTMTLHAVPADRRQAVRQSLVEGWLATACAWVAASAMRGNAWSASDHEWVLRLRDSKLEVSER